MLKKDASDSTIFWQHVQESLLAGNAWLGYGREATEHGGFLLAFNPFGGSMVALKPQISL